MMKSNTKPEYRIDIIRNHVKIGEIHPDSCTISYKENSDVMRTMKARVQTWQYDIGEMLTKMPGGEKKYIGVDGEWSSTSTKFDMFSDRLRPILKTNGSEHDFGDFIVIAAPKTNDGKVEYYDLETYDETMILKQAALTSRRYYPAGSKYLSIVGELLTDCGITNVIQDSSDLAITVDREWAVGTTYLSIANTLLGEIGYAPVHAGSHGYIYVTRNAVKTSGDYNYNDSNATISGSVVNDTDIYSLPNVIVGYVSNPDIDAPLISKKENNNINSQISIQRRGYKVVQTKQFDDCPDQKTLDIIVSNYYLEASQATESVKLSTLPDGYHDYGTYAAIQIGDEAHLYRETEWTMKFGGLMSHKMERKVLV